MREIIIRINSIEAIEGDYLETKEDNLIFDVKGLFHPNNRKICFLRFYPAPEGDRIREGVKYKKIYDLKDRYSFLREKFPKYLFFSKELDLELQGVRNEDIKKIYTPREYLKTISDKDNLTNIEKYSIMLCELFLDDGGIPKNSIGITGSSMVNLNRHDSDIDLIIYGTKTSLEFQDNLKRILEAHNNCRPYNSEEYKKHFQWRAGGSSIAFKDFIKSEKRKLHQGKFYGIDFFIRYIISPEDWQGNYYDYQYKDMGRIKLTAEIINSTDSIFTPCSYKIKVNEVLNISVKSSEINFDNIREVNSFRGRFCEQAIKGENVLVEGKLEEVNFKNEKKYYRILLRDQVLDKMILLS
ncbi:MAG: hypothetical protein ACTSRI_09570 [Promethearchaeota archaeon]